MYKNIIIMEDSSKHKFGGGQKVTLEIMNILMKNYNIYLVDCKKESFFNKKAKEKSQSFLGLECLGKVVRGNKSSFSLGLFEIFLTPFLLLSNLFRLIKFLKMNKLRGEDTLLYSANKKMLLQAYILHNIFGYKYVYHAHGYDDKSSVFYKIIYPALKNSEIILCVSNLIKQNYGLTNCKTLYNPIKIGDKIAPKSIVNEDKIIVASFSSLIKLKGIEYFMKAYSNIKNKNRVEFWVFGEGGKKNYLKQLESSNVVMKGFCPNVETVLQNEVHILVLPSIVEEACPVVPIEAFAKGVPVITTNIGGQSEIVIDNYVGYQVNIKNSQAIAQKIDFLVKNPLIYEMISKNAIEYSQKFSLEIYENKIIQILRQL